MRLQAEGPVQANPCQQLANAEALKQRHSEGKARR